MWIFQHSTIFSPQKHYIDKIQKCFLFLKITYLSTSRGASILPLADVTAASSPRAPRARTAGDICEEEELSKFPREGKVSESTRGTWTFGKFRTSGISRVLGMEWHLLLLSWSFKDTMAPRFPKWISLTSLLCLCCCVLAERKGMSWSYFNMYVAGL